MAVQNKTETVAFRLTVSKKRLWEAIADQKGMRLGEWMRTMLEDAARRDLEVA